VPVEDARKSRDELAIQGPLLGTPEQYQAIIDAAPS
jgi:hypothetical protein